MEENNGYYFTNDYCYIHGWGKCIPLKIISVKTPEPPKLPEPSVSPELSLRHFTKKSMKSKLRNLFYGNIIKLFSN